MRYLTGKVVSDKMVRTVVVEVEQTRTHAMYHKRIKTTKKYHAHNDKGAKTGDVVKMVEIKPMAATKNFSVVEILK